MTPAPEASKASRNKKIAAFQAGEKRRARKRRIVIVSGIIAAVTVAAVIVTGVVLTPPRPTASGAPNAKGTPSTSGIPGVLTFSNGAGHVQGPVAYAQTPPVGGAHSPVWLNCGIYTQPVPNENAVHDLEHGAVWVTYDPALPAADVAKLRALMPSTYSLLSPYAGLPSKIVLSAWDAQLKISSVTDPRIAEFFTKYRGTSNAPEAGGSCTGGLDAPGKL